MRKRFLAVFMALCMLVPVAFAASGTSSSFVEGWQTRAAFVQALADASGDDIAVYKDQEKPFADAADNAVIAWAYAKWLINGDDTGKFRPDDLITREEAATILGRYLDYRFTELPAGCGTGSPNLSDVSEWAQNAVSRCWMYGIIDTNDAPAFRPTELVSDADAAAWIKNANALTVSAIGEPEQKSFADSLVSTVDAKGNFTLSPYSARLCLAMLANGAKGDTQAELLKALQIDDLDAFNKTVQRQMETYDGYARIMSLDTANSIWLNQTQFGGRGSFLPAFKTELGKFYSAEAREVTDNNSVEQVNAWVKEQTKDKIPTILTEDNRDFATALVNAVYFKAAWENEFAESRTQKAEFTNADGSKTAVDMMHQQNAFDYYATPGVEAIDMDYRTYAVDNENGDNFENFRDANFSMYFIKADKSLSVQNLLDNAKFTTATVNVSLPKFKVEYGTALNDSLKALGIKTAYSVDNADFSSMVDPKTATGGTVYLDTVLQKTYLSVDEKGTEAAAVTAAMTTGSAAPPSRPEIVRDFTADSPFWFAIRDNTNGEILFVGRYETAS